MLDGAHDQDRTGDLVLTKDALYRLSYVGWVSAFTKASAGLSLAGVLAKTVWSGRRDSNPRPIAWKAMTLPTELLPLSSASAFARANKPALTSQGGQVKFGSPASLKLRPADAGGEGRIRTSVVPKHAGFTAQCH
jgi:hypothetical protein